MRTSKWWWTAALVSLVPALAIAQPLPPSNSQKMYEDIEILRRIMNRKLGFWPNLISLNTNCAVCHVVSGNSIRTEGKFVDITGVIGVVSGASMDQVGTPTTLGVAVADFDPDGLLDVFVANDPHGFHSTPTNVEGVYLKGQGATYTLTLPPPPRSRPAATKKTSSKPLTDWERARHTLRGDQPQPQKSEPAKEPSEDGIFAELEKSGHLGLTEAILRVLAENGQHFSQLASDEKITVSVTFREPSRTTANQNQGGMQAGNPLNAWGNTPGLESPTTWDGQSLQPGGGESSSGGPAAGSISKGMGGGSGSGGMASRMGGGSGGMGASMGSGAAQNPASVRDFELLGDMLLKQGKPQEAIKAFQRALNLNPSAKHSATLYRKIAQGDLMLPDDDAAKKALEMAAESVKQAGDMTKTGSPGGGGGGAGGAGKAISPPSLPSKLIIS